MQITLMKKPQNSQCVYQTNLAVRGIMREDCFFDNNFYSKPINN
jgi:hypothetical protein